MGTELESTVKLESFKQMTEDAKSRHIRAAIPETQGNTMDESERRSTGEVHNSTQSALSPPGNGTLSKSPSKSKTEHLKKSPTRPSTPLRLSLIKRDSLGLESQKTTNIADGVTASDKKRASPQLQLNTKAASFLPDTPDCDGCKSGEHCECSGATGAEARASVVKKGLQRTPRTDEAVWAAAALGFLLVLLTLSVLHTRLYRHWRTTPSLYWHNPQQDYDSVAGKWTTLGSVTHLCTSFYTLFRFLSMVWLVSVLVS